MPTIRDEVTALGNQLKETWAEARSDLSQLQRGNAQRSFEELNPPRAKPVAPPWDAVWKRYFHHWAIVIGAALGTPLGGAFFALVFPPLAVAVSALGFCAFAYGALRVSSFTCPRCGRRFGTARTSERSRAWSGYPLRCLYCGLPYGRRS